MIDNKTTQEIKLVFYTLTDVIVLTTPEHLLFSHVISFSSTRKASKLSRARFYGEANGACSVSVESHAIFSII